MAGTPFPGGKTVAVITSWDDGVSNDRIMGEMLEKYGYKGTFYTCSEWVGKADHLDTDGLKQLMALGHEIGSHSIHHPHLETLSPAECARQMTESKAQLEAMIGRPVGSFAYPYGFDHGQSWVADAARKAGYTSARTTDQVGVLTLDKLRASDPMRLPVTAYFTEDFFSVQSKWNEVEEVEGAIFHLWGHSAELSPNPKEWVDFECILGFLGGLSKVWYGTVGELMEVARDSAD
jgi:peptidoglycan/xylan/chitin deacetylase (PgdA/CDA1 family)